MQTPPLNARHADVSNEARVLQFGLRLYLHPYLVCASSEDSGDVINIIITYAYHARTKSGAGVGQGSGSPEKSQNIEFLSNIDPDPLKIYKSTKPAFNVGPSSACQRNAI